MFHNKEQTITYLEKFFKYTRELTQESQELFFYIL